MSDDVKPVASLEPGKTYVLKTKQFASQENFQYFLDYLKAYAPECRFLVLDKSIELIGEIPERHCGNCKHWNPWGEKKYGECILTRSERAPSQLARVTGNGNDFLVTRQEFGCVQFEAKDLQDAAGR